MYWHLHLRIRPWCFVWRGKFARNAARLEAKAYEARGLSTTVISSDYDEVNCAYRDLLNFDALTKGFFMTSPAVVRLPDGSDVAGSELTCEGCGSDMAGHSCAGSGAAGSTGSVTYARRTGPRAPVASIPVCVHCGGRIHQNLSAAAVNAECMTRQYALDTGMMTDPNGRLPVLTLEMMGDINAWGLGLSIPLTYGKMASSAGGASTYAGLRPKTGRRKKVVAAAPGSQIQDMADEESEAIMVNGDEGVTVKPKRVRKPKIVARPASDFADVEEIDEAVSNGVVPLPEILMHQMDEDDAAAVAPEATSEQDEAPVEAEEQARQSRAERRAARKALLAGAS